MVKKTIVVYEFDERDKVLLNIPLPHNPCDDGYCGPECCGCPDARKYAELVKPYRDAGIYEIARNIEKIKAINEQVRKLEKELNKANEGIPTEVRAFIDPKMFQ